MEYPENPTDCHDVVGNRYEYGQTCKSWPGISCAGIQAYGDMRMVHYSILNRVFRHVG